MPLQFRFFKQIYHTKSENIVLTFDPIIVTKVALIMCLEMVVILGLIQGFVWEKEVSH